MPDKTDATSPSTDASNQARDSTSTGGPKAVVKNVDMSDPMQQDCLEITSSALEKFSIEKDIAAQIKKDLDKKHGATWHVVVGKNFGSYVTHGEFFSITRFLHHLDLTYIDIVSRRNPPFHLLLCGPACYSHLEVIDRWGVDRRTRGVRLS
jgi:dynein light chain LC8-type